MRSVNLVMLSFISVLLCSCSSGRKYEDFSATRSATIDLKVPKTFNRKNLGNTYPIPKTAVDENTPSIDPFPPRNNA